jgi:hypothetical protein
MHLLISRKSIYVYDLLIKAGEDWEFAYNSSEIRAKVILYSAFEDKIKREDIVIIHNGKDENPINKILGILRKGSGRNKLLNSSRYRPDIAYEKIVSKPFKIMKVVSAKYFCNLATVLPLILDIVDNSASLSLGFTEDYAEEMEAKIISTVLRTQLAIDVVGLLFFNRILKEYDVLSN